MLIGICGKMGTGKDFIASNYIVPMLEKWGIKCMRMSFADQIKVNVMCTKNINFHDVFIEKREDTRRLLQIEGTENGRNVYGKDIWIRYFDAWSQVHHSRGIQSIITCDVRYQNELEYIKSKQGIIIKIEAPIRNENRLRQESKGDNLVYENIKGHSSECDLDGIDNSNFDLVIKNDVGQSMPPENIELFIKKFFNK
jgi:hypothetical protein